MIYILLKGRIGNQLFMYAAAKAIQQDGEKIVIDDYEVLKRNWDNLLPDYDLPNVEYVHKHSAMVKYGFGFTGIFLKFYHHFTRFQDFGEKYNYESKHLKRNAKRGLYLLENGYLPIKRETKNILLDGYFQSPKYFENVADQLRKEFRLDKSKFADYPNIEKIKSRNTVCISIKVEHNVGSSIYDVCNEGYWLKAIEYIIEHVDNPLFFICSDNVDYVKEHLIDTTKYDVVCQAKDYSVDVSLSVMAECKHFVIGNTTFGWWAQYLADNEDKIVVAPSRWMKIDMPIDIYEEGWHLIEV